MTLYMVSCVFLPGFMQFTSTQSYCIANLWNFMQKLRESITGEEWRATARENEMKNIFLMSELKSIIHIE